MNKNDGKFKEKTFSVLKFIEFKYQTLKLLYFIQAYYTLNCPKFV